jgi:hypothetical protein
VAKLPENVTPLRRRRGRKVEVEQGIRMGIHLTPAHRFFAERIGGGNVSKGIRELIERAAKEEEANPI